MASHDPFVQLIESSGNSFHARVARWFHADGWHIVVSPYYMDHAQAKAREIDLIVEKSWDIRESFGRWCGDVVVRLYIECKFVASPAVFWFADKDLAAAEELVVTESPFRKDGQYTKQHHYLSQGGRVAKLFASSSAKGQEVEPFYKALNQVLNAQVAMRGKPPQLPKLKRGRGERLALLEFPVVVCNSFTNMRAVDFYGEAAPAAINDNFQLEVRYAYADRHGAYRNDYFLLDFVAFDQLAAFGAAIDTDAKTAAYMASD